MNYKEVKNPKGIELNDGLPIHLKTIRGMYTLLYIDNYLYNDYMIIHSRKKGYQYVPVSDFKCFSGNALEWFRVNNLNRAQRKLIYELNLSLGWIERELKDEVANHYESRLMAKRDKQLDNLFLNLVNI